MKLEVDETGATYSDNARIKAQAFSNASGLAALADDSGLEVDALDGQPGALHHLHGWDGHNDAERIEILLAALQEVPKEQWIGRYQAVVVVVLPDGRVLEGKGTEEGVVVDTPVGTNGFGYDPIFLLPELGKTAAELSMAEKNRVSHRALATFAVRDQLRALASGFTTRD